MIIAIVGPTGVGKSEVALQLALKLKASIINADAFQVYQNMDIGTAKVPLEKRLNIPHHLMDVVSFQERFDVARYQKMARAILDARGQAPIILVGGSGFYLKSVLHDFNFPEKKPISAGEDLSNEALVEALKSLDPERLKSVHANNRKRLLNAYQRALLGDFMSLETNQAKKLYPYHMFGLEMPRQDLYQTIDKRVDEMIEQGLEDEVKKLVSQGISPTALDAIGYKEWAPYWANEITFSEVVDTIKTHTRRYAKRQISYFKHQFEVTWLNKNDLAVSDITTFILNALDVSV
jgi:tRNA dimethylallyltransferase